MAQQNKKTTNVNSNNSEKRKSAYLMLNTDFEMKYYTMIESMRERVNATRMSLTFLSAPFLVLTALLTTKVITITSFNSFEDIPNYLYIFMLICGLASIVPLWHFIESNSTYMRTIRNINNFRDYYTKVLDKEFDAIKWDKNFLQTDKTKPKAYNLNNWAGTHVLLMAIVNSTYISIGISCSDGKGLTIMPLITVFFVSLILQITLYARKK